MSRFKTVMALVLAVGVIGTGAALVNYSAWADEKPAKNPAPPLAEAENGEKLNALLKERRAFAKKQFDSWKKSAFQLREDEKKRPRLARNLKEPPGWVYVESLEVFNAQGHIYLWAQRLLTAELELGDKKAHRLAAYKAHLLRMREVEDFYKKGVKENEEKSNPYSAEAKFHRLNAEIMLERAKAK
jgi:hypothetical protein